MNLWGLIIKHLIFFSVGMLQDVFITYYYQTISKGAAFRAAFLSTTITLVNLIILYEILIGIENQVISIILIYAIGNGAGTLLTMKRDQIRGYFHKKR